jgi:hypothetical protein
MTRRDAAVLVVVSSGLYCLLVSLSYLSGLIGLFDPPVSFPAGWNPAVYFASYLVPFAMLLAAGQLLVRGRGVLARQVFPQEVASQPLEPHMERLRTFGSLAFTVLGLIALLHAVGQLPAVIQLIQPHIWHSASTTRALLVTVLQPLLLLAYVVLGWYLVARREHLARRWLTQAQPSPKVTVHNRSELETMVFKVVGLFFMLLALVPLGHALVGFIARGFAGETLNSWDVREAATGSLQLLFGLTVYAGKSGVVRAFRGLIRTLRGLTYLQKR